MAFEPKLKVQRSEIPVTKPIKNALLPRVIIPNIDCFLNGNKTPLPSLHSPQKVPPPTSENLTPLYALSREFTADFFKRLLVHCELS